MIRTHPRPQAMCGTIGTPPSFFIVAAPRLPTRARLLGLPPRKTRVDDREREESPQPHSPRDSRDRPVQIINVRQPEATADRVEDLSRQRLRCRHIRVYIGDLQWTGRLTGARLR